MHGMLGAVMGCWLHSFVRGALLPCWAFAALFWAFPTDMGDVWGRLLGLGLL